MTQLDSMGYVREGLTDYLTIDEQREQLRRIKRTRIMAGLIEQLPPDLRQVVKMRYVERQTWGYITRAVHVTTRTAHRMRDRAMDMLTGALMASMAAEGERQDAAG